MDPVIVAIFGLVYLGMFLGELPGLKLDRTGVALLGAIALVTTDRFRLADAWAAIDASTICLLLGLMVVSAQFRLAGFYAAVTRKLGAADQSPGVLLGQVVGTAGLLSAVLANDIVCLAMTPVLIEISVRRGLDPVPYLLALACASNVGSAATLIGNPQNMLLGEVLDLSFAGYLVEGGIPALGGLAIVWAVIGTAYRGCWRREMPLPEVTAPAFNRQQAIKGLVVVAAVLAAFLWTPWPRAVVALTAAGALMISRETASRELLGLVDWHLLLLFASLFVVNAAVAQADLLGSVMAAGTGSLDIGHPAVLFGVTAVLSNLVSNVPAVLLLLPAATFPLAGPILALSSTLAGNLLIVGSIANIIVVDQARRHGVAIDWKRHARVGIPVTLATLALAALWLWLMA